MPRLGSRGKLCLISCESGRPLGNRIAKNLNDIYQKVGIQEEFRMLNSEEIWFANEEVKTVIGDSVRGYDLYIIQACDDPLSDRSSNDNIMALATAINAAYHADAENISVILPQFPYSRQERRSGRECITARIIADLLENQGTNRVITIDVHANAIAGFFSKTKFENISARKVIVKHFTSNYSTENMIVVAPDVGSAERARSYAHSMKNEIAIIDKMRNYKEGGKIEQMQLVGDVKDKNVFMADDIIATGGTIINACNLLKDKGAKNIYLACSLPFFNGKAVEKLDRAYERGCFNKVIGTDAVFRGSDFINQFEWYDEVSMAPLIAQIMYNINTRESVSALFV